MNGCGRILARQGFQYALRLKPRDEALLRRWVGCRRFVINEALAFQRERIAAGEHRPGFAVLSARLPGLEVLHPWLAEAPAQALQQALKDLCLAWERKFTSCFGAPRFKKGEGDTVRLPQDCRYDPVAGTLSLPKLGTVRLRHSRVAVGRLKNVTIRQAGLRWIASLQLEREIDIPVPLSTAAVGLDLGVAATITPSTGDPVLMPVKLNWYERRMKRLQREVSRKQRGSSNRRKAVRRLAIAAHRAAAIRRDTLHKATTELVRGHALIAIEDLAVKNMTASAAGTVESPGRNVRAKAGLNRSNLRNAWSAARRMLEYKALWNGVALVAINPAYTSQECSACGHVAAGNRKSQSNFACVACGHAENADRNAAKNILRRAHLELGGCLASTGGHPETHACEGVDSPHPRPHPAARGSAVGLPLAGTASGLESPGISIQ